MIHHGKPICESLIIVEYIDEVWSSGRSILPSDPIDRATARFWGAYVDDKFFPILRGLHTARDQEAKKAVAGQIAETFQVLENALAKLSNGKPFFGGDAIGYVDIAFGSCLGWIRGLSKLDGLDLLDGSKFPGLVKWADTFSSDPAVKDLMPDTDKIVEFSKILRATRFASGPPK
uniref:glutathione transferase n=1 Tax=Hypericum annulatum TaxID=708052 RepID=A0A224X8R3_9ROSI